MREPTNGPSMSVAVGRFKPGGPDGYRARSMPCGPLRATRAEAVADESAWLAASECEYCLRPLRDDQIAYCSRRCAWLDNNREDQ